MDLSLTDPQYIQTRQLLWCKSIRSLPHHYIKCITLSTMRFAFCLDEVTQNISKSTQHLQSFRTDVKYCYVTFTLMVWPWLCIMLAVPYTLQLPWCSKHFCHIVSKSIHGLKNNKVDTKYSYLIFKHMVWSCAKITEPCDPTRTNHWNSEEKVLHPSCSLALLYTAGSFALIFSS